MHRHHLCLAPDGDYIVWESLALLRADDGYVVGSHWIEHTRWLIPGTQIED